MKIVLIGEVGSGKNVAQDYICNNKGYKKIVTYTTRPMREKEKDGETYYFVSKDNFLELKEKGFFLETKAYNTKSDIWYYGTPKNAFDEDNICSILDIDGSIISKKYGCKIIYLKLNENKSIERIFNSLKRLGNKITKVDVLELERRIKEDKCKFNNVKYDYIIEQDYSKNVFNEVDKILREE